MLPLSSLVGMWIATERIVFSFPFDGTALQKEDQGPDLD